MYQKNKSHYCREFGETCMLAQLVAQVTGSVLLVLKTAAADNIYKAVNSSTTMMKIVKQTE